MNRLTPCMLIVCCTVIGAARAWAAWPTDLSANVPVDTLSSCLDAPVVVPDGAGGSIVVWSGARDAEGLIRAQHLDANGQPAFVAGGLAIAPAMPSQRFQQAVPDGAGGAIVVWENLYANGHTVNDLYAQRVSGTGELLWGAAGIPVCIAAQAQNPLIATDGAGGAIMIWRDLRLVTDYTQAFSWQIFGQHVNAAGQLLWQANGKELMSEPGHLYPRGMVEDGEGGAIAVLAGGQSVNADQSNDVFALRMNADGDPQWGPDGVPVCALPGEQDYPLVAGDGSGGAVVSWADWRNDPSGESPDVYAQKLDALGASQWTPGGIPVCVLPGPQYAGSLLSDGTGGAFLTWVDGTFPAWRNHVQRIAASGSLEWGPNGVLLSSVASSQQGAGLSPDGSGGVFTQWLDDRGGQYRVFAQRLSGGGTPLWAADGVAVSNSPGRQWTSQMTWDGANGAVVAWLDQRSGDDHVYAQGFGADGVGTGPIASAPPAGHAALALAPAGANPSRGTGLWVRFALEGEAPASIDIVDITGRRTGSRRVDSLGPGSHVLELLGESRLTPGVYLATLREGTRLVSTRVGPAGVARGRFGKRRVALRRPAGPFTSSGLGRRVGVGHALI